MAWTFVGLSGGTESTSTTLTLGENASTLAGDLLVAVIAQRTSSTTSITAPTGWTRIAEQKTNNTVAGATTGIASAAMFYIVRGASAPPFVWTLPAGNSIARGRVISYRGNTATPFDVAGGFTTATGTTAVSGAGLTTTQDDDLIVAMCAGGQAASWTNFATANAPSTGSGASDLVTAPSTTAWIERYDVTTVTGADTSLGIFDAVKTAAGATGNVTVTAALGAGHAVLLGSFKIAPPSTADAWNVNDKSADITLSNSDKTATNTSAVTTGVRSTQSRMNGTAGKFYAEFSIDVTTSTHRAGLIPATGSLTATNTSTHVVMATGGITSLGTSGVGTVGSALTSGAVLCMAWDAGAELIWFRKDGGSWNNSGSADPATSTGGLNISGHASVTHSLWTLQFTSGLATTLRTELAEYTQAIPSGFISWMGETPAGGTPVTVSVTGQAVTAAVGEVTVSIPAPVSITVDAVGQAATAEVGNPSVTGKSSFIATGQAVTSAVGPLALIVTHARFTPTAPEMIASTQGVGVSAGGSISTTASGSEITSGVGEVSVKADHRFSVLGQQVASSVGEVSVTGKANVITLVAGQETTAGVGQVTVDARASVSTTATGQQVTSAVGEVSVGTVFRIDDSVTPAGQEITSAVGTPTVTGKANVSTLMTGQAVTTAVGTPTVTGQIGVSTLLAGQELVSAVGVPSITTHARFSVTGQAVTSAVGQVGVSTGIGTSVMAAGQAVTAAVGPPAAVNTQAKFDVTGQEVIASGRGVNVTAGGSVSTTVSSGLATTAAGQVGVAATHRFSITGAQADTAVGQVGVTAKQTVSTTVVGQSLAVALSPVTVTAGTRASVTLAGQQVTSAVGPVNFSLAISALVPLVGYEMSTGVGAIYFPIGLNDSVTLDGQSVQAEVGAVTVTTVALRGMDVWTGASWAGRPVKVWTGSGWAPQPVKVWNGSAWV